MPPLSVFLTEAQAFEESPDSRVTESLARYALQEHTSVGDGGRGALSYVLLEKPLFILAHLRRSPRAFSRFEGLSPLGDPGVALHRGEAHIEQSSGLGFGDIAFEGLNYLLAQIFGIGFHVSMIAHGSRILFFAVGWINQLNQVRNIAAHRNQLKTFSDDDLEFVEWLKASVSPKISGEE